MSSNQVILMAKFCSVVQLLAVVTCHLAHVQSSPVLYFSIMVSDGLSLNTTSVLPAVEQEVQSINSDTCTLPGYNLQYNIYRLHECNSIDALRQFLHEVKSGDHVMLGMIGCGCSAATDEVAKISSVWNIPLISYASSSAVVSDRRVYRNYYRTIPSDELLPPLLTATMKYYEWKQLVIVTETTPQYLELLKFLRRELTTQNISLETTVEFTSGADQEEFRTKTKHLAKIESHVVLLNTQLKWALEYLCSAYHNNRLYPNYAWILHGLYNEQWWATIDTLNCTKQQIVQALDRVITISVSPSQVDQTDAELVSSYAVDAVRSLVLSLNATISEVTAHGDQSGSGHSCSDVVGETVPLELFNYSNGLMSCLLMNNLADLSFSGKSGHVKFDEQGNRFTKFRGILKQYRRQSTEESILQEVTYAFVGNGYLTYEGNESNNSVWPDGIPPDGTPVVVIEHLHIAFTIITGILAALCITLSLSGCVFMVIFRERKVVKLTSPKLNYLIVAGTILLSLSMFQYSVATTNPIIVTLLCWGRAFCASTGHDICFAVALLKTWRVYYIFKSGSSKKQIPKDSTLLAVASVIILLDFLLYIVLLVLNQITTSTSPQPNLEKGPMRNDQGVLQFFYFIDCAKAVYYYVYIVLSIGFKYILHIIAGIFAFSIRKVKVDPLNDFRYVSTYVYISSILITLFITAVIVARGRPNMFAGMLIGLLFLEIILLLSLVFIPKMVYLYRDPQGDHIFDKSQKVINTINTSAASSQKTSVI